MTNYTEYFVLSCNDLKLNQVYENEHRHIYTHTLFFLMKGTSNFYGVIPLVLSASWLIQFTLDLLHLLPLI